MGELKENTKDDEEDDEEEEEDEEEDEDKEGGEEPHRPTPVEPRPSSPLGGVRSRPRPAP